jgi:hypothetical protein
MQTHPKHRGYTPLSALLLVVQCAFAAAIPLADAVVEAIARDGPAHLESQNSAPCPPGHDHLQCQFCRVAGTTLVASTEPVSVPRTTAVRHFAAARADRVFASPVTAGPLGPRAPPGV